MKYPFKLVFTILMLAIIYAPLSYAGAEFGEVLSLSESPPSSLKKGHRHAGGEHSEHQASPMKKFYLNTHDVSDSAEVYIMRPDGSVANGALKHGEDGLSVVVDTKPMDFTMDGIFNVYVVDKKVVDGTLIVQIAKMNVINHSCGWGHKWRHTPERLAPKYNNTVPLEIVGYGLWNEYFHTRTMSGDNIKFTVLSNGKPIEGASVKMRMQTGWVKAFKTDEEGNIYTQLIRDYYPEKWSDFDKRKRGQFLITAEYDANENGEFKGSKYNKVKMTATMPWKYYPQRNEYTSYLYGLIITVSAFLFTFGLVFFHRLQRKKSYKEIVFNEK